MKYHYIYKTTNNINGKYYYGKHSSVKENDIYIGSGTALRHAKEKYGNENFTKEILAYCDSSEDALELEEMVVTQEEINNDMCYNIKLGGKGGSYKGINKGNKHWLGKKHSTESKEKNSRSKTGELNPMYGKFGKDNKSSKKIEQINKNTNEVIKVWDCARDVYRELGYNYTGISVCLNNKRPSAFGFKWRYHEC